MLPVVVGPARAARVVFASTLALVATLLLPGAFGAGPLYMAGRPSAAAGFVYKSWRLARASRQTALASFFASLLQLSLLLARPASTADPLGSVHTTGRLA